MSLLTLTLPSVPIVVTPPPLHGMSLMDAPLHASTDTQNYH